MVKSYLFLCSKLFLLRIIFVCISSSTISSKKFSNSNFKHTAKEAILGQETVDKECRIDATWGDIANKTHFYFKTKVPHKYILPFYQK